MMPRLREFYPYTRGKVGPHEYGEYLEENAPSPDEYMNEPIPSGSEDISVPGGGGAYLTRPEEVTPEERGQMEQWMRPGGIDERIAQMREGTAEIRAETARIRARMRPPEGVQVPEFSDAGRNRYEQGVFKEIQQLFRIPGGDPFKINPTDAVDRAMTTQLPKLFKQVFGGRVRYEDADRLEGKWLKYWNQQVLKFKAEVSEKAEFAIMRAEAYYKHHMGKYDTRRKAHEGKLEQIRKERLKPPDTRRVYDPVTEEYKIEEYKSEFGKWVDTGKKWKPKEKPKEEKPKEDELKKSQMLDDWRADYKTRLNQLKDDYGDFNAMTGLWIPNRKTYDEYKKKRDKLINEYEKGMKSILKGTVPKRMAGTLVGAREEEDYVGKFIKDLTKGY